MKDVMLDIETLGNGEYAAIVQISACYFDRVTGEIGQTFDQKIDLEDACKYGQVDGSTLKFWLQQDPEVIRQVMSGTRRLDEVLMEFELFARDADCIWSHATFDFVIVQEALKKNDCLKRLKYKSARDLRTLCDLAQLKESDYPPAVGKTHNALDDCYFQVKYAVTALNKLLPHQGGRE